MTNKALINWDEVKFNLISDLSYLGLAKEITFFKGRIKEIDSIEEKYEYMEDIILSALSIQVNCLEELLASFAAMSQDDRKNIPISDSKLAIELYTFIKNELKKFP